MYSGTAVYRVQAAFSCVRQKVLCVAVLDEVEVIAPRKHCPTADNVQRKVTVKLLNILDCVDELGGELVDDTKS